MVLPQRLSRAVANPLSQAYCKPAQANEANRTTKPGAKDTATPSAGFARASWGRFRSGVDGRRYVDKGWRIR